MYDLLWDINNLVSFGSWLWTKSLNYSEYTHTSNCVTLQFSVGKSILTYITYITLSTGQEDINCNDRSPLSRHPNVYNGNVGRPLRNFISQQFLIKSFRFNLKQSNRNFIPTRMKRGSIKKTLLSGNWHDGFQRKYWCVKMQVACTFGHIGFRCSDDKVWHATRLSLINTVKGLEIQKNFRILQLKLWARR